MTALTARQAVKVKAALSLIAIHGHNPRAVQKQAQDELDVKIELQRRNPGIVPQRDIEKLQVVVNGRQGTLDAVYAAKQYAI